MVTASTGNLMPAPWANLDTRELRLLMDEVFGGPGQYDGIHKTRLHIPLAGDDAQVVLHFKSSRIARITAGPAFDANRWAGFANEVQTGLIDGPRKIARGLSFASQPVQGSWKGKLSGVQILPPPRSAPLPPQLLAEHPFVLEFPLHECSRWSITNHRRLRLHERLSNLLNVLLKQRITTVPRRSEQLWAIVYAGKTSRTRWVQRDYFAKTGRVVRSRHAPHSKIPIVTIEPSTYYGTIGNDGQGLRLPADLDLQIFRYLGLPLVQQERFDRAAYWMSMAARQWEVSTSLSFTALVSAVEALTEHGVQHRIHCPDCNKAIPHDAPGATERFRAFFSRHAAGTLDRGRQGEIYALRSGILHGSNLITLDFDLAHGWDPPWWNERELHGDLWRVTSAALRNWLQTTG